MIAAFEGMIPLAFAIVALGPTLRSAEIRFETTAARR